MKNQEHNRNQRSWPLRFTGVYSIFRGAAAGEGRGRVGWEINNCSEYPGTARRRRPLLSKVPEFKSG